LLIFANLTLTYCLTREFTWRLPYTCILENIYDQLYYPNRGGNWLNVGVIVRLFYDKVYTNYIHIRQQILRKPMQCTQNICLIVHK